MGYVLGLIESLTVCLLLLALVTACSARLSRRWLRVLLPLLTALVPLLAGLALSVTGVIVMRLSPMHSWILYSAFPWTLAFATGAAILLRRGLRAREGTHRPALLFPFVNDVDPSGFCRLQILLILPAQLRQQQPARFPCWHRLLRHIYHPLFSLLIRCKNSDLVFSSSLKEPSIADVIIFALAFSTPRIIIHIC